MSLGRLHDGMVEVAPVLECVLLATDCGRLMEAASNLKRSLPQKAEFDVEAIY